MPSTTVPAPPAAAASTASPAPAASAPRAAASWWSALARRVPRHWPVKMVGTTVWIAGFFWLYFWVMRHPAAGAEAAPLEMPVTALDRWLEVHDWAFWPYASLWFYVALAPALAQGRDELSAYVRSAGALCVGGLLFFWLLPTAVPPATVDWSAYPTLAFMKARDGGSNAFPSLHVAFALHSAVFVRRALAAVAAPRAVHAANWAWAAIVVWSVFATRQHVLVDVLGGLVAGAASLVLARPRMAATVGRSV